jgi:hypothetical protein
MPQEHQPLFAATIRALTASDYLRPTTDLSALDLPGEVEITEKAHAAVDGWPGASPTELVDISWRSSLRRKPQRRIQDVRRGCDISAKRSGKLTGGVT